MSEEDGPRSLTVLFADISDSTRLYDELGNEAGRRRLLECLDVMKREVERSAGTVVDRIGDELMCTFPDALTAATASTELHRAVDEASKTHSVALRIRIGIHHGPVVVDEKRIFGDTVHIAHRIASLAKAQQTLISRACKDRIPPEGQIASRFVDRTHLKGKDEVFEIFEIVWDEGASTVAAQESELPAERVEPTVELILRCGDRFYTLDADHPTLTIGRDARADVVVDHARVSRLHGRIEYRKSSFVFVDESTNGSQVVDDQTDARWLRRTECPLASEGRILLGPRDSELELPVLTYRLRRTEPVG